MHVIVHVFVVVKHMAKATVVLQACMKGDYSPDCRQSQELLYELFKPWSLREAVYGRSCTTPDTVPAIFRGVMEVLTALVVVSNMSIWPPWTT